jgi:hypothetical protein
LFGFSSQKTLELTFLSKIGQKQTDLVVKPKKRVLHPPIRNKRETKQAEKQGSTD